MHFSHTMYLFVPQDFKNKWPLSPCTALCQLVLLIKVQLGFWNLIWVVTMAAPNRHYELKKLQLFIKFTFIGHTNLKFGECKKKRLIWNIHFAAPWTLLHSHHSPAPHWLCPWIGLNCFLCKLATESVYIL